jgi:hypothetical protein
MGEHPTNLRVDLFRDPSILEPRAVGAVLDGVVVVTTEHRSEKFAREAGLFFKGKQS